jgi:hypothetical protein
MVFAIFVGDSRQRASSYVDDPDIRIAFPDGHGDPFAIGSDPGVLETTHRDRYRLFAALPVDPHQRPAHILHTSRQVHERATGRDGVLSRAGETERAHALQHDTWVTNGDATSGIERDGEERAGARKDDVTRRGVSGARASLEQDAMFGRASDWMATRPASQLNPDPAANTTSRVPGTKAGQRWAVSPSARVVND